MSFKIKMKTAEYIKYWKTNSEILKELSLFVRILDFSTQSCCSPHCFFLSRYFLFLFFFSFSFFLSFFSVSFFFLLRWHFLRCPAECRNFRKSHVPLKNAEKEKNKMKWNENETKQVNDILMNYRQREKKCN